MFIKYKYSKNRIENIHKYYVNTKNETLTSVSKKYNIGKTTLFRRFNEYNLSFKKTGVETDINDNFFSKINSEIKAYLLGFFAADGHIATKKRKGYNTFVLSITIHKRDIEILNLFNKYIAKNNSNILKNKINQLFIRIYSKQIGEDLKKLGYDNRKTYTCKHIPKIPQKNMHHFIRGFFDGDGCISYSDSGHRKFNISCFSKSILTDIWKNFPKLPGSISLTKREGGYLLASYNKINLKLIYKYLYYKSKFYLTRKKEKFKLAII